LFFFENIEQEAKNKIDIKKRITLIKELTLIVCETEDY